MNVTQQKQRFYRTLWSSFITSALFILLFSFSLKGAGFLEENFINPPDSARPRVWWHWMNGNISKEGIAKDLEWMKRIGVGGVQTFDAGLKTPQIVDRPLLYMSEEWKDAFRFAVKEADRLGLELTIASSPGWSETGGPWVPAKDGMKKLVWSEIEIDGGIQFNEKLPIPPSDTGPFQSAGKTISIDELLTGQSAPEMPSYYDDALVLAYPIISRKKEPVSMEIVASDGQEIDKTLLLDDDLDSSIEIEGKRLGKPSPSLKIIYPNEQVIRSATVFLPGAASLVTGATVAPQLEYSLDGVSWELIGEIPVTTVPTTVSFAPVSARFYRVVFNSAPRSSGGMSAPSPGVDFGELMERFASIGGGGIRIGDLQLFSEAKIDQFEAKAGYTVAEDYYTIGKNAPEVGGVDPSTVLDITNRMNADGVLDWTPPMGQWRILRLGWSLVGTTNHPAPAEATGLEVDKFDGSAVERYLEHYLELYRDAVGPGFLGSRGIKAILNDSIEVGAANWTPRMIVKFNELRNYDPTPWLPALTGTIIGTREQSDKFLYDYRRTLADLMAQEHYGTVARVAHQHGLKVYGEALESGRRSLGDDMAMRSFADIPMSAMWTHSRKEGPRPSHIIDIKGAASVAHVYGQNLVAAESLTSFMAPWDQSPDYLKRIIDLAFVTGVNLPVIHTSVHQPVDDKVPGLTLSIFGQYFNRHETWAELAKPWVDYLARNSFLLQQGKNVADVGYFYGEEGPLTSLYGNELVSDAPVAYAYDFVNFEVLMNSFHNEGSELVTPGGARYKALYLGGSSKRMTLSALKRIYELVSNGATVIGMPPDSSPSLGDDPLEFKKYVDALWSGEEITEVGKGMVIASKNIDDSLQKLGVVPQVHYTSESEDSYIPFVHRRFDGGNSFFIVNTKDCMESIEAHFRIVGKKPELWHADTGKIENLSYRVEGETTIVPIMLLPEESVHVVFRESVDEKQATVTAKEILMKAELDGSWSVSFQEARGAPDKEKFECLIPLNEHDDPGIKYFSGVASYHKEIEIPDDWDADSPLFIDLGEVREIAEVLLNGNHVGYVWHSPYRVDIGREIRKGKNRLEVRVANLWVNRLIGDAQGGNSPISWTSSPTYRPNAPLRKSGLIGPVRLFY